jgi:hypothetical protein
MMNIYTALSFYRKTADGNLAIWLISTQPSGLC